METTNKSWAAYQISMELTKDEIWVLQDALKQLDKLLYKSWAKDFTLSELIEIIELANTKRLVSTSGHGIKGYHPVKGKFEVKAPSGERTFDRLSDAVDYYNSLEEEAALWDVTIIPELVECKQFVPRAKP